MATVEQSNTTTNTASKRKADAFINVTIVSSDGENKRNVGGIPLYKDKAFDAKLIQHLKQGGEVNAEISTHIVTDEVDFEF